MTLPTLMNCAHRDDGWCDECVARLGDENMRLRSLIKAVEGGGPSPEFGTRDEERKCPWCRACLDEGEPHGPNNDGMQCPAFTPKGDVR